jgi:hypothetical protein
VDDEPTMKILIAVVMAWLASQFDLPIAREEPEVRLATQEQMAALRYGPTATVNGGELIALYEDRTRTILLAEGWTGESAAEVSVLVHELVHHLQNVGGLSYRCPAAREALAYAAQERWLELFGSSLEKEFGLDRMTLLIGTRCMH